MLQKIEKIKLKNSSGETWWQKTLDIFNKRKKPQITKELEALVDIQKLALRSLLKENPDLPFANYITSHIERIINKYEFCCGVSFFVNQFTYAKHTKSVPLKVFYGLITALLMVNVPFTLPISLVYLHRDYTSMADEDLKELNSKIQSVDRDIEKTENRIIELISQGTNPLQLPTRGLQERIPIADISGQRSDVQIQSQNLSILLNSYRQKQKALREGLDVQRVELELEQGSINTILYVILAITAGTLGSVVSILTRIEDFQDRKYKDRLMPFFIGAFKPVIGAAFGVFLLAIFSSDIIVLNPTSNKNESSKRYLIFTLAFVAGFSERLAKDIILRTEDAVAASRTTQQSINISDPVKSESIEDSQTKRQENDNSEPSEKQDKLMDSEDLSLLSPSSQKPKNEKIEGF
ncbi:MAG: hypothetical protein KME01_14675 [Chroococcus sp. CMT-3BRIN-NPC107]|nr:hypothetical protein [Chroococcus sp. CMT-3BRIN-NPC107]